MNEIPKRLFQGCISIFLLITAVFFLIRLIPGDPALLIAGPTASAEVVERIRQQMGLDQPVILQFATFVGKALQGDLGVSTRTQRAVASEIAARVPFTLSLALAGIALAAAVGLLSGILAAILRNTVADVFLTALAVLAISAPSFWLALMLVDYFSIRLGWLPSYGARTGWHYVLPALVIGASQVGLIMRVTRSSMIDTLNADYIRTARAKGAAPARLILIHGLRNALIPIITVVCLQMGVVFNGAVVTESIFNWPGLGRFLIESVLTRDYPAIQALVLVFGVIFVLINLLSDLLNALIDPRLRTR